MKVFIVYCHPSKDSFTNEVYKSFERGLRDAGHEIFISDLYDMNFKTDISEEEYLRETYYRADGIKSKDEGDDEKAELHDGAGSDQGT